MTATAKLVTKGRAQVVHLPKEFRFPGKTVTLRRTRAGVVEMLPQDDLEKRRARFMKLAGSCPDFPLREPHTTPDLPRDFS